MGLGAALLSDETHAHAKTGGHRPVNNIKKIMATLVVQRALKRNMIKKRGKFNLADIVLAAEGKTRRASRTRQHLPNNHGLHSLHSTAARLLGSSNLGDTGRLSSTGQLSTTGHGGLEEQEQQQQRWQQHQRQQREENARGSAGLIVLPPDADESKWLMRRFLVDLQRHNDKDEEEGGEVLPSSSRSSSVSQAANGGSNDATSRATALQLLNSRGSSRSSSGAKTEIGSPPPRGPARTPDRRNYIECGNPNEESLDGMEEKMEEVPATSLAVWLRGRDSSVDL